MTDHNGNFRKYFEWVIEEAMYDFDPGGYLSDEKRTEYADRILDALGWDGLMYVLDRHYPGDVFPSGPDLRNRDAGPRIVSLIRHLDDARKSTTPPAGTRGEGATDGTTGMRPAG